MARTRSSRRCSGRLYAIDATWEERLSAPEQEDDDEEDEQADSLVEEVREELEQIREEAERIRTLLAPATCSKPNTCGVPTTYGTPCEIVTHGSGPCVIHSQKAEAKSRERLILTDDDVLLGLFAEIGGDWHRRATHPYRRDGKVAVRNWARSGQISAAITLARGLQETHAAGSALPALRRLLAQGLVERIHDEVEPARPLWRFTTAGRRALRQLPVPAVIRVQSTWGTDADGRVSSVELPTGPILRRLAQPGEPCAEDLVRDRPQWIALRKEAQAKGRRAYRAWLETWRTESGEVNRLPFADDEVHVALTAAVKKAAGPVAFDAIMAQLAPGKFTPSEAARISQSLVRLERAGKAAHARRETPQGRRLWQTGPVRPLAKGRTPA